jgi:peptide deformylase
MQKEEPNKIIDTEIEHRIIDTEVVELVKEVPADSVLKRIVPAHNKKSRDAVESDVEKIVEEVGVLHAICFEQNGRYKGAYAMHHSQIESEDPINFFVTWDRMIIINPVVLRHSNYTKDSKEACMSFPTQEETIIQRWQKMDVEYTTIMSDPDNEGKFKLSSRQIESLSGPTAFIYQHEISHGNGILIYPINEEK